MERLQSQTKIDKRGRRVRPMSAPKYGTSKALQGVRIKTRYESKDVN